MHLWDSHFWLSDSRLTLLVMKTVAHLDENFPWIQIMRAAKRETVIQQHPPVRHVRRAQRSREPFSEFLSRGQVKGDMRLKINPGNRRIPVGKARPIVNVGRSVRPPRQRVLA